MQNRFLRIATLFIVMASAGCATIVSKTSYPLYIRSTPIGARVTITDKKERTIYQGVTPAKLRLQSGAGYFSKARYEVTISADGYQDRVFPVYFKLNAWYFGNILFGGVVGMLIIDPLTGAMWKLEDPVFDETLVKVNSGTVKVSTVPTLEVIDINTLSLNRRAHLVPLQ